MHHPQGSTESPKIFPVSILLTALCCFQTAESDISWRHPTKLSLLTIELLAQNHGVAVKDLQISNFSEEDPLPDLPIYGLEKLHAADMDPNYGYEFVSRVMVKNHLSLKHLKLGCEEFIALPYLLEGTPLTEEELWVFTRCILSDIEKKVAILGTHGLERRSTQRKSNGLLNLQTLHLTGFDFQKDHS